MKPNEFVQLFKERRASAILRTSNVASAREAMNAAVRGGFTIIEFTLSIPNAYELIREFSARPDLVVGAGTVLTPEEARLSVEAGAQFLVSPVFDPLVTAAAQALNVAAMPGCATPTEMLQAHRAGAALQKLFPGQGTGPLWVQQTLGPLPFLKIVPTSGVTLDNAAEFLKAGSHAVGFVNSLFVPADISAGRWDVLEERARAMIKMVSDV